MKKISSYIKISDSFKKDATGNILINLNSSIYLLANKNKDLSKKLYIIPGTMELRIGYDYEGFIKNLVTVIIDYKCVTWKEKRRSLRKKRLMRKF